MAQVSYGSITITDTTDKTVYIAYASDNQGTNFSPNPASNLLYVGINISTSDTMPPASDSGWKWSKYTGIDGVSVTKVQDIYWFSISGASAPSSSTLHDGTAITSTFKNSGIWTTVTPEYQPNGTYYTSTQAFLSGGTSPVFSTIVEDEALTESNRKAWIAMSVSEHNEENAQGALAHAREAEDLATDANAKATVAEYDSAEARSIAIHNEENAQGALAIATEVSQNFWPLSTDYSSTIPAGVYLTEAKEYAFKTNPQGSNIFMQSSTGIRLRTGLRDLSVLSPNGLSFFIPSGDLAGRLAVQLLGGNNPALTFYDLSSGNTYSAAAILDATGLYLKHGGVIAGTKGQAGYLYISSNDHPIGNDGVTINGFTPDSNSEKWRQVVGTKFGVTNAGTLYATNAVISGTITIGSGSNVYTKEEANGAFDANGAAATAQSNAISAAATDATNKANAAQSAAATDATNKANAAQSAAITAAATDATNKANAAQSAAEATAAADATSKANAAQAAAETNAAADAKSKADAVNNALEAYKTTTNSTLTNLQNQVDGQIEAWYYEVDPTTSNPPASSWNTDELKARHEGDLYYNVDNGHSWRWLKNGSTYSWQQIPDGDAAAALAKATEALGVANNKRRIFTAQPTTPYDGGDLWVNGSEIKYCKTSRASGSYVATDWSVTATDDTKANSAAFEEQYIYISKVSGTLSVSANTTWVTESGDEQNTWTTKRPTYSSSYPVLFVAKQKKTVSQSSGNTCSCSTPVKDDTTTVIDGGHITTGTIDAARLNVSDIIARGSIAVTSDIPTDLSDLSDSTGIVPNDLSDLTDSTNIISGAVASGVANKADKSDTVNSVTTETQYRLSDSSTGLSGSGTGYSWSTTIPTWSNGKYLWTRIATTYTPISGSATTVYKPGTSTNEYGIYDSQLTAALSTASSAQSTANEAVSSVVTTQQYNLSSSIDSANGTWQDTVPTWSSDKYIWVRLKIVKTLMSGTVSTSYTPSENGTYDKALTESCYKAWVAMSVSEHNEQNAQGALACAIEAETLANNAAPKANAVARTQQIYYRSNSNTKPTVYPTTWVTAEDNKWNNGNTSETNFNGWRRKVTPISDGTGVNATKYLYLWTATQKQMVDGTVVTLTANDIALDDTTTVIDGGKIITGSIDANKINVQDLISTGSIVVQNDISDMATQTYVTNQGYQTSTDVGTIIGQTNVSALNDGSDYTKTANLGNTTAVINAGKTASNYLGDTDSNAGVTLKAANGTTTANASTSNYIKINGSGLNVYKQGVSIASYGDTARIGKESNSRFLMNATSLQAYNSSNKMYFEVSESGIRFGSDLSSSSATYKVATETYVTGQGYQTESEVEGIISGTSVSELSDGSNYATKTNAQNYADDASYSVEIEVSSIDFVKNNATLIAHPYFKGVKMTNSTTPALNTITSYSWSRADGTAIPSGVTTNTKTLQLPNNSDLQATYVCTISK